MRTKSVVFLCAVLMLGLSSCMQQPDVAGVRKAIEEANAVAAEAYSTGDYEKALAIYADDATVMPPNSGPVVGKDAYRQYMDQWKQSGLSMSGVKFTTNEVEVFGNFAYETGGYEMTVNVPGMGEVKDNGKFIAIWKKQADGSWKLYRDIWNTSVPHPEPEPPKDAKKKK